MKNTKKIICTFCFLLILPGLCLSQPVRFGPGMRQWRGEEIRCGRASDLNLSSDQVKGLDVVNQMYLRETRLLRTELFSKRLELREFLTNPTIKTESIHAKNSEIIELQSKLDEKAIEYLVRVRTLLTQEQLKHWCPEQEFPFLRGMIQRAEPMGPMNPRRMPSQMRPKEE